MDVVEHDTTSKVDEHCTPVVVYRQQQTHIRGERNDCNVLPILKRERSGLVATNRRSSQREEQEEQGTNELDEIKDGHAVPDRTQQTVAIWSKEDVALFVNRTTYV